MSKITLKKICLRYNFIFLFVCSLFLIATFCTGCDNASLPIAGGSGGSSTDSSHSVKQSSSGTTSNQFVSLPIPTAKGESIIGNDSVSIDISDISMGYYYVTYLGSNGKVKMQVTGPDQIKYTYNLPANTVCLPVSGGTGEYSIAVFENISGDKYSSLYKGTFTAQLENEFYPFLYSNMYVNYDQAPTTVQLAASLATDGMSDLEYISTIYHYIIENITYDDVKAETVAYNYLPVLDDVLQSKKGICFDYASLMAGMLRSQHIPTRLQIGYAGEAYHAWISVYVEDIGWIDNLIRFDGTTWSLMDPTFAANSGNSSSVRKFIGDGSNYNVLYTY